ncbi:MAG: transposase [Acidimicrobiaceae bacterium]|nr:transposase [Acidimicrobiaceae bacterium]MYK74799.1 transposase [Acidimicrobiaceae bacterium]
MSNRIDTRLVQAALDMAGRDRAGRGAGTIFHSDHGSQYLSEALRSAVTGWGLAQSVGRVGSSADNAVAEAFFSSLKRELVNRRRYPDRATARRSIFEWLARYNTTRRHTSLPGCLTPDQYEAHYHHSAGTPRYSPDRLMGGSATSPRRRRAPTTNAPAPCPDHETAPSPHTAAPPPTTPPQAPNHQRNAPERTNPNAPRPVRRRP